MDKIEDPRDAQAFLNQIKGLFGDTQCLYLISISDDAMAAYERRGLPLRDAFDSSLSTVITLSYLSRQEARSLIGARLVRITQPASDLLYVLSGGLARELVRLIHRAVDIQRGFANATMTGGLTLPRAPRSAGLAGSASTPSQAESALAGPASSLPPVGLDALAVTLIKEQVSAQRRAVLIRGRVIESCSARDGLLAWASDPAVEAKASTGSIIDVISAADYFHNLLSEGEQFLGACKNDVPDPQSPSGTRSHAGECAARETGAFLLWLATVGQVFEMCRSADDFRNAEQADSERSFERLARARQNFALGAGYVQTAVSAVRTAWDLGQA
jgi:hypothetical protein